LQEVEDEEDAEGVSGDAEDTDALEDDLNEVTHSHHTTTQTPPLARHHSNTQEIKYPAIKT